ncbi:MAG: hypothetical protein ABL986_15270 [Vicinamibacterales bacterium]
MRPMAIVLGVVGLAMSGGTASAQVKIEPDQQYLILEVSKLATFEDELSEAAKLGFRIMMSTTSDNGQRIQALLERAATPSTPFEYRMVATASTKTGDKEMNAAAAEGFRVVPHTAMLKKGLTVFNANEVEIMEKSATPGDFFEYLTITAVRTGTFHRELRTAVEQGWRVVDMTYGKVLLERKRQP